MAHDVVIFRGDAACRALLRLLRDIQQNANAHQSHEQRRSSVGNEGQRNSFGRHQAENDADVNESLQHDHAGDSHGQKAAEVILRAQRSAGSAPQKDRKQKDDSQRSDQSQFFGGYRKDKIRVRLRKIEQFLFPFHQAESGYAAGCDRNQRLNNVEAEPFWVGVGIEKGKDAVPSIRHMKDEEIKRQQRGREGVSKVAQADAGDEQDTRGNAGTGNGGTEVGLKNNQSEKDRGGYNGRDQRIAPVVHGLG